MSDEQKRPLVVYVTRPDGGMTETEASALGAMACDALVDIPIWLDGVAGEGQVSHRQRLKSWSPTGEPLVDADLFRVWSLMAFDMATRPGLNQAYRMICKMTSDLIEAAHSKAARPEQPPGPILIAAPPNLADIVPPEKG